MNSKAANLNDLFFAVVRPRVNGIYLQTYTTVITRRMVRLIERAGADGITDLVVVHLERLTPDNALEIVNTDAEHTFDWVRMEMRDRDGLEHKALQEAAWAMIERANEAQ